MAHGSDVLDVTERVAWWQLNNPCSFDIRWQEDGASELTHVRLGWDGRVLRQRKLPASPKHGGVTPAWDWILRRESGDIAFLDLPVRAQAGWRTNVGLDPERIVSLKMMDEGATRGWEMATLYMGLIALSQVSERVEFGEALARLAEAQHWELAPRMQHADDLLVGYAYLTQFQEQPKMERIASVQARLDWLVANRSKQGLDIREGQDRWTWCDALFMAPPVWLKMWEITGNDRYLEFMDQEWWATTEYLYDKEARLFYRDAKYFEAKESNGKGVFWSRGNAWVIASLALMLETMPRDLHTFPKYVQLFQELAASITALQPDDGLWRASLLDPTSMPHPESSSSAFFCYALARGVRLGILDNQTYGSVIDKTWTALQRCVQRDGRLGFVQQPGAAPGQADEMSSAPYGVGAFLMAGSEMTRREQKEGDLSPAGTIVFKNEIRYIGSAPDFALCP